MCSTTVVRLIASQVMPIQLRSRAHFMKKEMKIVQPKWVREQLAEVKREIKQLPKWLRPKNNFQA